MQLSKIKTAVVIVEVVTIFQHRTGVQGNGGRRWSIIFNATTTLVLGLRHRGNRVQDVPTNRLITYKNRYKRIKN